MKKLQNNFTTPEQSKRLLELGMPEWTANCVLRHYNWADDNLNESNWELPCVVWSSTDLDRFIDDEYDKVLPCWSVGRIMEICKICGSYELAKEIYGRALMYLNTVDGCICEMSYERNKGNLNFSKLEE